MRPYRAFHALIIASEEHLDPGEKKKCSKEI